MTGKNSVWFGWMLVCAIVFSADASAQTPTQQPAQQPPTQPDAEAPSEAEPGEQTSATGEDAPVPQRRRMVTTTSAQLKIGDKTIALSTGIAKTDGPDYASIAKLGDGDVLALTRSQAIKLKTELPLTLGDVTLKTENVSTGYAGVYALWIKKTASGWSFVFTDKADLWGTMYNPADNVAEVPVSYAKLAEPKDALTFELPQAGQGGSIKISWGEHEWTAPFTLAQ